MRILSLDGGGVRGLITARILQGIEAKHGRPVNGLFDLVVGSSIGGILSLLLTRPDPYSAGGCVMLLQNHSPEIFSKDMMQSIQSLGGLTGPKYSSKNLRNMVLEYLPDPLHKHNPVVTTTYDTQYSLPVFVKSWVEPPYFTLASTAALATSAAPTYFPPVDSRYIDGGTVANNPSVVGLMCAHELIHVTEPLEVLSIGTGIPKNDGFTAGPWGALEWIQRIIDVALDGNSAVAHMVAPSFASKYLRLQPFLPEDIAMDDASDSNLVRLDNIGKETFAANESAIDTFFAAAPVSTG